MDSTEKQAITKAPGILANLFELPEKTVVVVSQESDSGLNFLLKVAGYNFQVECKSSSSRAPLLMAIRQIAGFRTSFDKNDIPLIVVPYMVRSGMDLCKEHGVSWIDLSGNAHIKAPGLLIHIEGRPNKFKKAGRPANVFAPKGARIVRRLLIDPKQGHNQRELSQITGLDEGYTSRIVRRLEELHLIDRDDKGALKPSNPDELLEAWLEAYDFSKHQIIKGHVAARSGEELLKKMTRILSDQKVDYAATGLAGAWQYTHFANFRLVTLFLADSPGENFFDQLHFREDDRGANTWIVVPNDKGVFHGSSDQAGIVCVHPAQVYLDLKGHPERAKEAASMVRQERLKWRRDA
ncbi:MAG: type IV toxin-antitoxin system AbiEi family antitoxin [Thermodesulfobacteriota bacterium]|nr:type IV toxin-antitoxin system AbiEi family antitoxin [Thermodesulfobacteriota bacterium]